MGCDEDDVVFGAGEAGGDEFVGGAFVVFAEVDGDEAAAAVGVVVGECGFFDDSSLGGEDEVGLGVVVAEGEDGDDVFVGEEFEEVGDVLAFGVSAGVG